MSTQTFQLLNVEFFDTFRALHLAYPDISFDQLNDIWGMDIGEHDREECYDNLYECECKDILTEDEYGMIWALTWDSPIGILTDLVSWPGDNQHGAIFRGEELILITTVRYISRPNDDDTEYTWQRLFNHYRMCAINGDYEHIDDGELGSCKMFADRFQELKIQAMG